MVTTLIIGPEGPGFKTACARAFSVHPTGRGCPHLFRAGQGEGCAEEEWHPASVALLPGKSWLFNSHFPMGPLARGIGFTR